MKTSKGLSYNTFIDRDSDPEKIANKFLAGMKAELVEYLEDRINRLQGKDAGSFETVNAQIKASNKEITNMHAFFRGAVVPYYYRQTREYWDEEPLNTIQATEAVNEIKNEVGFIIYGADGMPILDEDQLPKTNSTSVFVDTKEFTHFLNEVEAVCFTDQGYKFPDSDHFKEVLKNCNNNRGHAEKQMLNELKTYYKNMGMDL